MKTNFTPISIFQMMKTACWIMLLGFIIFDANAATIYVRPSGNDNNTGAFWGQAFQTVQRALEESVSGDQIWVAAGTYKPSLSIRTVSFIIPSGIKVYGGFAGNEQNLSERNPDLILSVNQTTLSGDLASNDSGFSNQSENSYRVVIFQNASSATELDGFTISGAYNTLGNQQSGFGGGIYNNGSGSGTSSNPQIRNCKFEYNSAFIGGGIYNDGINGGNASPFIENCTFINNQSFDSGAAMANYGTLGNSSPIISRCFFIGNSAGFNSGAMNNHGVAGNSSPVISNSVFIGNSALNNGGVMVNTASSGGTSNPVITNCSFSGNKAGNVGGVIRNLEANVQILNTIIWGNSSNFNNEGGGVAATYSLIEGGYSGTGNLSSDPQFIIQPNFNLAPTTIGNLQLNNTSPAINAGTNSGAPTIDILGNVRPYPGTITDIGAYESIAEITCFADADGDGFGNPLISQQFASTCGPGFVSNNTDCNDNIALERPGQMWYKDTDNDGYAQTGAATIIQCLRPAGYKDSSELISTTGDCDDNNDAVNPGATEICDDLDNNCNGQINEGVGLIFWYSDLDGDGFGNPNSVSGVPDGSFFPCSPPPGFVTNNLDCNDLNPLEYPGQTWYADLDNDGYSSGATLVQCLRPAGYKVAAELTSTSGDCNDIDPLEFPGQTWYADLDNDGYSSGATITQCLRPIGYKVLSELITAAMDCNDNDQSIKPGASEICDGIDNDCDGSIDEGNVCCPAGNVIYVDINATGANNGSSWENAYTHLQNAINNNCPGITQIWVATGIYYPSNDGNRSIHFTMRNNRAIYGGFNGTETMLIQRNWTTNPTILSGDIGTPNDNSDNSFHVVRNYNISLNTSARLDGFTITGGNANGSTSNRYGGGLFNFRSNAIYANCTFIENTTSAFGGGVANQNSAPTFLNCHFINNTGTSAGGGMFNESSDPILTNCSFNGNFSHNGGGIYSSNSSNPSLFNCSFSGNRASGQGGAVLNFTGSTSTLTNCIIWKNQVGNSTSDVGSSIGNASVNATAIITYSLIENSGGSGAGWQIAMGTDGGNNLDTDPMFVLNGSPATAPNSIGDLHLQSCSPAIDTGTSDLAPAADIDGTPRPSLSGYDIGAYEFNGTQTSRVNCFYDNDNDGYGNPELQQYFCESCGTGYVNNNSDCNDNNASINPAATEVCDGIDNNCNAATDEGVLTTYYADNDGDSFGDPLSSTQACAQPEGFVSNNTDCDDNDALERPGQVWYKDTDNDGYAQTGASTITQCLRPAGYKVAAELTNTTGDCNDDNSEINPGTAEICNDLDDDCNGIVDDIGGSTQGNWDNDDIGNANGTSEFPPCEAEPIDTFYVQSYGFGQPNSDTRHMVYQNLCGDMSISARILDIDGGGWAGISMQESLSPGSKKAALKTQLTNTLFREIRSVTSGNQNLMMLSRPQHNWLKLTRTGNVFTGYTSVNGVSWSMAFTTTIIMNECIQIGLFAESINNGTETSVEIDQVNITGGQNQNMPLINHNDVADLAPANFEVALYPNPVNAYLYVRLNHSESNSATIQVLGLLGELWKETKVDDMQAADNGIDMSDLPAGIYLLRVTTSDKETITKRIIKQ